MKLSKSFLSDYIDLSGIDYNDLAEKMVSVGNEYDSVYKICESTNLVVGKVVECKNHKDSDHLHITKVDIGEKELKQIVCGAPNVKEQIKVIVAKEGAVLPGGEIKKCTLKGEVSEGMICSLSEIGLPSEVLKEEDSKGIHILNDDAIVGTDAIKYLGYDDEVIDFELTTNRADLLSIIGMAYEVGAIYNRKPNIEKLNIDDSTNKDIILDIKTDKCLMYLGKIVKNVQIKESPEFIKSRLIASGIRPINNVVDISNYVMLEYGNPLHFFDYDRLGNKVIVRCANEKEKFTTLDGKERILNSSDIVIANEDGPVALAGVMGGLNTEVENDTKNIFIEAAIFDPASIRRTSNRILRSEASNRYEKGIDPNVTIKALQRAADLLEKYAGGEKQNGIAKYDNTNKNDKIIEITLDKINSVLGMNLTTDDVDNTLDRLNFSYEKNNNNYKVTINTRRLDVNIKEDLIEEIGRIYGFTKIDGKLPILQQKKGVRSRKNLVIKEVKNRLCSLGLTEVIGYSLLSEEKSDMFKIEDYGKISVLDPMSEDRKILRKQLVTSLLDIYNYNKSRNVNNINIFEVGSSYFTKGDEYIEEVLVSGLLSDNIITNEFNNVRVKPDFYLAKGIVENLLKFLGLTNRYEFKSDINIKELHPGRKAGIYVERQLIGYIGQVHPSIEKNEIYVFELNLTKLMEKKVRNIKCKEISKFPNVSKDLAFIVDKDVEAINIINEIKKSGGRLLKDIKVFDVYTGDNIDKGKKSIAFSLTFEDNTKTLTDEEVNQVFNKIIDDVENKLNAKLRNM